MVWTRYYRGGGSTPVNEDEQQEFEHLIDALRNGRVDPEFVRRLREALGPIRLGQDTSKLSWPDGHMFVDLFCAKLLAHPMPPSQKVIARSLGCDRKTLMTHLFVHLGIRRWEQLLARLLRMRNGDIKAALTREDDIPA
jgi:hypothetical protein